jgi:exonuclease SbcC
MRPLELNLTSFRSYASQTVDFRPYALVVISGDTGAGKTTLLDAIAFALYGRTPEQSSSRDLLTLGASHGEVRLTFEAAGRTWRVTRRLGTGAPEPAHLLEELAGDGGETVDHTAGVLAVNARLVELVGMGFQSFTSAVLLAQGRFAQFLQASPRERDAILRELFGITSLEAVRVAALTRREAAEREVAVLTRERDLLPEHHPAARNAAAAALRAASAHEAALRGLRPLADAAALAGAREREAAAAAQRIAAALGDVAPPGERRGLVARCEAARQAARAARTASDEAQRAVRNALARRDGLRTELGGTAAELAALRGVAERGTHLQRALPAEAHSIAHQEADLAAARERLQQLRADAVAAARRRDAIANLATARAAMTAAQEALHRAESRRREARVLARHATDEAAVANAALDELRRAHLAATLRASLVAGAPCPVCGQVVRDAHHPAPDDLQDVEHGVRVLVGRAAEASRQAAEAEAATRSAGEAHRDAAQQLAGAERAVTAEGGEPADLAQTAERVTIEADARDREARLLSGEVERAEGALAEVRRRLEQDRAELADLAHRLGRHGESHDPPGSLARAVAVLEDAESAAAAAGETASRLASLAADADAEAERVERAEAGHLRQSLTVLATRLRLEPIPPGAPLGELPSRADDLVDRAERARRDTEARAAHARAEGIALAEAVADRGAALGVGRPDEVAARHEESLRRLALARSELAAVEGRASQARRLARAANEAQAEAELHGRLAADLQANRFPRHLLARFHERLASGASARLQNLSRGAFGFAGTDPDPLAVIDHRRGRRTRTAATLSGGERFLASLALALALADIASGSSGRLDCLFLDEGFSALDAESLEVAIEGVERMADDGRLVVVITHLPGIAERLGAEIRVRKDPSGTSHIVDRALAG